MPSSDIDFLLGIERTKKPKRKRPPIVRKTQRVTPRKLKYGIAPVTRDVDFIKLEYLTQGFCNCGRRMQGEAACAHCIYDETYL